MTLLFVDIFTKGGVMGEKFMTRRGEIAAHLPVLWQSLTICLKSLEENNHESVLVL